MELLLRRDQRAGLMGMGSIIFTLDVRADLTEDEINHIRRYKLGKVQLYSRGEITDPGSGWLGLASRLAFKMINLSVSVDDLSGGKHIECKDILEMLAVEEQIKEAARTFRAILEAAATFGGEEVVQI